MDPQVERNKAVVRAVLVAADRGDLDAVRACFSEDYVDHSLDTGSRLGADREAAMRAFADLASAFGGLRHTVLDLIAEGDKVVLRVAAAAVHEGEFRGIAPTGCEVTMTQTVIYRLRDGRIVERWVDGVEPVGEQLRLAAGQGPKGRADVDAGANADTDGIQIRRSDADEWHADASGGEFWELRLGGVSLTCFRLEPGIAFPAHAHDAEQITLVLEGSLSFELDDERVVLGPGDAIAIPAGRRHAVVAGEEPVLAVDAWSPPPEHLGAPRPG